MKKIIASLMAILGLTTACASTSPSCPATNPTP